MNTDKAIKFLSLWALNSLLFVVFGQLLAGKVVLGNDRVVAPMALVFGGLILTLVIYVIEPVIKQIGYKGKDKKILLGFYLVANFIGIWIIKRLERVTGVGISSTLYVVVLATIATFGQWFVMRYVTPLLLRQKTK